MKAGITLRLHVAGLPAEVSGIYTEESGIILDGSLRLASAGNLRDALEFLLEKCGHRLSLSFLPQVQADAVWMTYRQKQAETDFGVRFRDGKGELGLIQAVMGKSGSRGKQGLFAERRERGDVPVCFFERACPLGDSGSRRLDGERRPGACGICPFS